jgi:P-type E1-E2 ATPase
VQPTASVVRDGHTRRLPVVGLVAGDLVQLAPGDQVVADGRLESAESLTLDESILSGESQPIARSAGEDVRSGSSANQAASRRGANPDRI